MKKRTFQGLIRDNLPVISIWVSGPNTTVPNESNTIKGWAIIDSGATFTSIALDVVNNLGLAESGEEHQIMGAAGSHTTKLHHADIYFPDVDVWVRGNGKPFGVLNLQHPIQGTPVIVLIGRDILSQCIFVYNGPKNEYEIQFFT